MSQRSRSRKAGRPPAEVALSPQARRRRKTARAGLRKDTTLSQTDKTVRARWAGKPNEKKR